MPRTDLDPLAARAALRDWVLAKAEDAATIDDLDSVALFDQRLLTSLHLPELILTIERLCGDAVDAASLTAEDVASIDAVADRFFGPEPRR